ncbi:MAG TPA: ABC transporter ATP-binding protein [Coriobacteriia bacterium]|nr:ABC transporter ATP-binding protein [Coriobacteriia bacterium]
MTGPTSSARENGRVIEARDVRMRYGANDVLHDVCFNVDQGEVVALLGPNGAGKTTMIEILEGLRGRSAGEVVVLGEDPATAGEDWRARTGVVLQSWRDHARWTPRMLLAHIGRYYEPYSTRERRRPRDADKLLAAVGLEEKADQKIRTLSGGQRRRLDVAIGLVGHPELLFLDEPTAGLDPHGRREFHDLVKALSDREDTTILLTTHDLAEAERLAGRILVLAAGRIIANGSAEELARQIGREAQVRWRQDGVEHARATRDPTSFVRDLLTSGDDGVTDLEVRRPSLEETYLALVHEHEGGHELKSDALFEEART